MLFLRTQKIKIMRKKPKGIQFFFSNMPVLYSFFLESHNSIRCFVLLNQICKRNVCSWAIFFAESICIFCCPLLYRFCGYLFKFVTLQAAPLVCYIVLQ